MPCYAPRAAWRTPAGTVTLTPPSLRQQTRKQAPYVYIEVPCTKCEGCHQAHASAWALRCQLELSQHDSATFSNFTYADAFLPITLSRKHLADGIKRIRSALSRRQPNRTFRFFASGEYGETFGRPHYHAILYGLTVNDSDLIEKAWGLGHVRTYNATPETIAYTAGYTAKKEGHNLVSVQERIDPRTGEKYNWQPPFIQMSRRPGIAAHARQWRDSWRLYAIIDGAKRPVPRYLHEAWREWATDEELKELQDEKLRILQKEEPETYKRYQQRKEAQIRNAQQRHHEKRQRRTLE